MYFDLRSGYQPTAENRCANFRVRSNSALLTVRTARASSAGPASGRTFSDWPILLHEKRHPLSARVSDQIPYDLRRLAIYIQKSKNNFIVLYSHVVEFASQCMANYAGNGCG